MKGYICAVVLEDGHFLKDLDLQSALGGLAFSLPQLAWRSSLLLHGQVTYNPHFLIFFPQWSPCEILPFWGNMFSHSQAKYQTRVLFQF